MLELLAALLKWALRWVRYLYFLRSSLLLWIFPLFFVPLNGSGVKTLTSGILVPEYWSGYTCVAFFMVSSGFVALILARIVLINGPERWNEKAPPVFRQFLVNDKGRWWWETVAVLVSQIPNVILFIYMLGNSQSEGVKGTSVWVGFLCGTAIAGFVWWTANAFFYVTYDVPDLPAHEKLTEIKLGTNAARTMLFPRAWFGLTRPGTPLTSAGRHPIATIETATTSLRGRNALGLQTEGRGSGERRYLAIIGGLPYLLAWTLALLADRLIGLPGYLYPDPNAKAPGHRGGEDKSQRPILDFSRRLYEGHAFAIMSTAVFAIFTFLVWTMGAPVPAYGPSMIMLVITVAAAVMAFLVFLFASPGETGGSEPKEAPAPPEGHGGGMDLDSVFGDESGFATLPANPTDPARKAVRRLRIWKFFMTLGLLVVLGFVLLLYWHTAPERFPILASVTIMVTQGCWTLAGIAFFADRYRVPVLTTIVLLAFLPRISGLYGDHEEHYFSTISYSKSGTNFANHPGLGETEIKRRLETLVPSPAEILNARLSDHPEQDQPLIIVTATGGGIHASAWTSAVLAQLEHAFQEDDKAGTFRQHVLLMSSVSGGSVGLLSYLRAINDANPNWIRMQATAECSSLEAVGWGLLFYDSPKAFVPFAPFLLSPSPGDDDLDHSPLFKDRTWSLRKSFARNLNNDYCAYDENTVREFFRVDGIMEPEPESAPKRAEELEQILTLRGLLPDSSGRRPAFTMNTTSMERGARFLLANYEVPQEPIDLASGYPAQSFLDSFGCCKDRVFDLPLATAAQLSATFPYVSSTARAPKEADVHSVHFGDGGYYDNDGTASALEFLRYALATPDPTEKVQTKEQQKEADSRKAIQSKLTTDAPDAPKKKLRILLIEIRNSPDPEVGDAELQSESLGHGGGLGADTGDWNSFHQLAAPLQGFWNAGHESVTYRNRGALSLLEDAFKDKLMVHRIVFDDENSEEEVGTDPLSWSLTPKQRREVLSSSCVRNLGTRYAEALNWFKCDASKWKTDTDPKSRYACAPQADAAVPAAAPQPAEQH